MNHDPPDHDFDAQENLEDLAMDSVLREYGESCTEAAEFLARVELRMDTKSFFGRRSLMDQIDKTSTTTENNSSTASSAVDQSATSAATPSASNKMLEVEPAAGNRKINAALVACAAAVLLVIGGLVWTSFRGDESRLDIAEVGTETGVAKTGVAKMGLAEDPDTPIEVAIDKLNVDRKAAPKSPVVAIPNSDRLPSKEPDRIAKTKDSNPPADPAKETYQGPTPVWNCLLYTSPSPRDATLSRMPSSA